MSTIKQMSKSGKTVWLNYAVLFIAAFLLTGGLIWANSRLKQTPSSKVKRTSVQGIAVASDADAAITKQTVSFITGSVLPALIPKELDIKLTQKGNEAIGNIYIANWTKNNIQLTLLLGLRKDNKEINYQRIWTMIPVTPVSEKSVPALLSNIFSKEMIAASGPVTCHANATESKREITDCGALQVRADGNKTGVTVRTPFEMLPPPGVTPIPNMPNPETTIISACFIPQRGIPAYTAPFCI